MEVEALVEQLLVLHLQLPVETCTDSNLIAIRDVFLRPICLRPVVLDYVPVLEVLHVVVVVLVENSKLSLFLLCLSSQLFRQHRLEHHLTDCVVSGQGVLDSITLNMNWSNFIQYYLLRPVHQVEASARLFVNECILLVLGLRHNDPLVSLKGDV